MQDRCGRDTFHIFIFVKCTTISATKERSCRLSCNELYKYLPFYVNYFTLFNMEAVMKPLIDFVSRNHGTLFANTLYNCVLFFTPLQEHRVSANTNIRKSRV